MFKIAILLVILHVFQQNTYAVSKLDSLTALLKHTKSDTAKITLLINLTKEVRNYNLALANTYAYQALEIAKKNKNLPQVSLAYISLGTNCYYKNDCKNAIDFYLKSLKIYEELKDYLGMTNSYEYIGNIFLVQSNFAASLKYYVKSLDLNNSMKNKKGMAKNYQQISSVYLQQGMFEKAISYCNQSIVMSNKVKDIEQKSFTLYTLGLCYYYQDKKEEALKYILQAYDIQKITKDLINEGTSLIAIGDIYNSLKEYKKGVKYNKEAYNIGLEAGNSTLQIYALENITTGFENLKTYDSAFYYQRQFIRLKDSVYLKSSKEQVLSLETKYEEEKEAKRRMEELIKAKELKQHRITLQYFGIFFGLLVFVLAIYFSGKLILNKRVVEGLIFITLVLFIEFILVVFDSQIDFFSKGWPVFKLAANAILALIMSPLHQMLERFLTKRMYQNRVNKALDTGVMDDVTEISIHTTDGKK